MKRRCGSGVGSGGAGVGGREGVCRKKGKHGAGGENSWLTTGDKWQDASVSRLCET